MTPPEILYNRYLVYSGQILVLFMLLPVVMAIWRWQYLTKALKIFFVYCVLTCLFNALEQLFIWAVSFSSFKEALLPYLKKWGIKNTNFLSIFFFTKNLIVLSLFFYEAFKGYIKTYWIKPLMLFLVVSTWINYLFIEGYKAYSIYNHTVSAVFCIGMSALFLWYIYTDINKVALSKNPYFWIGIGLVSMSLLSFFLFLTGDKIRAIDKVFFFKLAISKNIIYMSEQILEAVGFYYAPFTRYMRRKEKN